MSDDTTKSTQAGVMQIWFERLAKLITRYPLRFILPCLVLFLALASRLPGLVIDPDIEGFLRDDSIEIIQYDAFRQQFGRDDRIVMGIAVDNVFKPEVLERLRELHQAIERDIPWVADIESLINVRAVYGDAEGLKIEDLFESWPDNLEERQRIIEFAKANPLYANTFISANADFTVVYIEPTRYQDSSSDADLLAFEFDESANSKSEPELLTLEQNFAQVEALRELAARFEKENFSIYLAGQPVLNYTLTTSLNRELPLFTGLSLLLIVVLVFLIFRSPLAILPPIIVVVFSLFSTLGCMSLLGIPVQIPTQILPSLLIAIGVADAIHIQAIFYQQIRLQRESVGEIDKAKAIHHAIGHAAAPVLLTSITTAAGLASFTTAELVPVAQMGFLAPLGVLFAFFYSVMLLPGLLLFFPVGNTKQAKSQPLAETLLVATGRWAGRHPGKIIAFAAVLFVMAAAGMRLLGYSHNPVNWLDPDSSIRQSIEVIDNTMAGSMSINIMVDLGEDQSFKKPENLQKIDKLLRALESLEDDNVKVGKTMAVNEVVKEVNQALNENQLAARIIPDDPLLVSQELLLFENGGIDDMENLVDSTYSKARISLFVNWTDSLHYEPFVQKASTIISEFFSEDQFYFTGLVTILSSTFNALIRSVSQSFILALLIITPLMMLVLRNFKLGLLAIIPNALPICLCLGFMGYNAIPFDGFTMLIGGIAIGLVVDDTIHFFHHFSQFFKATGSVEQAVEKTLATTGRALLFTTLILCGGFSVFLASSMENLTRFGLLTGMAVMLAFLADVVLMPAILSLLYKNKASK